MLSEDQIEDIVQEVFDDVGSYIERHNILDVEGEARNSLVSFVNGIRVGRLKAIKSLTKHLEGLCDD